MPDTRLIFGPPGTGKTTRLLELAHEEMREDRRVGFVSFSRRAIAEARERIGAPAEDTEHFRTIHSTAYHLLGLTQGDVLSEEHLAQFSELIGFPLKAAPDPFDWSWDGSPGDVALSLYQLAAARRVDLATAWRSSGLDIAWNTVDHVATAYRQFKRQHALWDFTDMISEAQGALPVDTLIVDEAQDTSLAQWALLRRIVSKVSRVIIAGDDDQAVYQWSGAAPEMLLKLNGAREVLAKSYRLPLSVKLFADAISGHITRRVPKYFTPRAAIGHVDWITDPEFVDLRGAETFLLLARSNYQLRAYRDLARAQGVVYSLPNGAWSTSLPAVRAAVAYEALRKGKRAYRADVKHLPRFVEARPVVPPGKEELTWDDVFPGLPRDKTWMEGLNAMPPEDREYIRALRRGGEPMTGPGRVRIQTVHGSKGGQADNVVLSLDISERVAAGARIDPDAEYRVMYVGATRARARLTLVQPRTQTFWPIAN